MQPRPNWPRVGEAAGWIAAAILSASAAMLAVRHDTPIDAALPLIAALLTVAAWAGPTWLQASVPLVIVIESTVAGEPLRLMLLGLVVAAVFAISVALREPSVARGSAVTVAAILLLRWIPLSDVPIPRELLLLALGAAITAVLRGSALGIAAGVLAAYIPSAVPLRTLLVPIAVLIAAVAVRASVKRVAWKVPFAALLVAPLLFFAWSGVMARAPLYFLQRARPAIHTDVHVALAPGERVELEVPQGAQSLVVSGANVAHLPVGTPLGAISPGERSIRIGDAADWGFMRREQTYASHNPLPRHPAGEVRGYGYGAWVDGAGRIAIPRGVRSIVVRADPTIPSDAALQVEGFELAP